MKYLPPLVVLCFLSWTVATADESQAPEVWKAGVASAKITPERRLHMAGYAARKEPVEGTVQDLFGNEPHKGKECSTFHGCRFLRSRSKTLEIAGLASRKRDRA